MFQSLREEADIHCSALHRLTPTISGHRLGMKRSQNSEKPSRAIADWIIDKNEPTKFV